MKKYIIPLICYILIILVLFNAKTITSFLSKTVSNKPVLTIPESDIYAKKSDYLYVQNSKDYIPYSYQDLLNIFYSALNNGFEEFTFYCPSEYTECLNDYTKIMNSSDILTHINNYVHPYHTILNPLEASHNDAGEITLNIKYIYTEEEINKVNEYVDKVINELYKKDDSDYNNIKRIHDYIINHTKYDIERNNTGDSKYKSYIAYGPAIEGYATCNGYADLMAIILTKLGYENYKIGTTNEDINNESDGHVWNAVKIDDKWLHIDLTWDDPVPNPPTDDKNFLLDKYLLVTTEELKKADEGEVMINAHNFNVSYYQEFKD